jgi:hypothetical protein
MNLWGFEKGRKAQRKLYRIMRLDHLLSLFRANENVLVPPAKWDDPFENFVLKSPAIMPTGEVVEWAFREDFFGQCWTFHTASDAMWRIYSPGGNGTPPEARGIRIRTTAETLLRALVVAAGPSAQHQAFLGKVRYLPQDKMRDFGNEAIRLPLNAADFAKTLLVKRLAFRHEREARLLFLVDRQRDRLTEGRFHYPVNPHEMVEQIMVDPRLTRDEAEALKARIGAETHFKGPILHSGLYVLPQGFRFQIAAE